VPVVLYGCETWSLTSREGHRWSAFEIKVIRRIFGPQRDAVTGGWRKLNNEGLYGLYCSLGTVRVIKSWRMRWMVHVARMGKMRNKYNIFVRKPEGRRPLGRPRRFWENSITTDLKEIGFGGMDWIRLAQE
jgi:hypothetical protein